MHFPNQDQPGSSMYSSRSPDIARSMYDTTGSATHRSPRQSDSIYAPPLESSYPSNAAQNQASLYASSIDSMYSHSMYRDSMYASSGNASHGKAVMYAGQDQAYDETMRLENVHRSSLSSADRQTLETPAVQGTLSRLPDRPLRVAHINAALIPAGIEFWLAALRRFANPSVLQFLRTVVLTDWIDPRQIPRMGMPVEAGGRQSVVHAASECDILLVSDPGRESQLVAQWICEAKPPVVVFVAHGDGAYTASRMAGIGPAIDHIVAVSEHVRREICGNWPVSVILNGVDPHRLVQTGPRRESRRWLGFSPQDFVVGFVGRFSEEKNPQLVVDAVRRMPPQAKLLLVGYGNMQAELEQLCKRDLLGRSVVIEGDGNLGDLYACMDVLVMPSRLEGYGLVAMEAMMCGVPVVATPFGMISDLVTDHVHALVVPPNSESIAAALSKLARFPSLRKSLVAGGRQLARQCGYASQMAAEYESLLTRLWVQATRGSHADR